MEPQFAQPNTPTNSSPESPPASVPENLNQVGGGIEAPVASPEAAKAAEQLAANQQGGAPLPVVAQPVATPVVPEPADQTQAATVIATTPQTAADGDKIEVEWIDKVKHVISSTSDDPYSQQKHISQLMANYVLKRYGRKIGGSGE
ncbi:MAG: hypothetical protein LBL08_00085 [Candidatus Nomurabacteria bacterium]|jgi:hypothetical protein|nr:hypothetical protein [Candidatus Nomurabacteria bacterium]